MFKLVEKTLSSQNNKIELWHNNIKTGRTILFIGGFHGDEPQGVNILNDFLNENKKSFPNSLYIIPCLNPDGFKSNTRTNSNGTDLNRNFPTKNWQPSEKNEFYSGPSAASEIETQFMVKVLSNICPDVILTLHAPFKIVNYDGPAKELSETIGKIMNYPVENDIGYPTPGSFGTYCGVERNIKTITLELGEDEDYNRQKSHCYKVFDYLTNLT